MPENLNTSRTRGLRPNPEALGYAKLAEGMGASKAMRFTLPLELVARLEAMPKLERDALMSRALRSNA